MRAQRPDFVKTPHRRQVPPRDFRPVMHGMQPNTTSETGGAEGNTISETGGTPSQRQVTVQQETIQGRACG